MKFALTVKAEFIITVQVIPLVVLHPVQPVNVVFDPGVAVSVTDEPCGKLAVRQVLLVPVQLTPVGELTTVPGPVPVRATVRVSFVGFREKSAETC